MGNENIDRKPVDASIIQRITGSIKYMITGVKPDDWMSPNQPLLPIAQEVKGRTWDFPVATNLDYTRVYKGGPTFVQLRGLAENYDILRLCIETRKDQLENLNWVIKPRDRKDKAAQKKIDEITEFFQYPDKYNSWRSWYRMLLEDVLVIDAPSIYVNKTNGNKLYSLDIIDGATITRVINSDGKTPAAPSVAYQQILKGVPAVDLSVDDLIYIPRNPRVHKLYGYSPVEQSLMTINIAMRREVNQLQYYTEGNIPEALASVPADWNAAQIKLFQEWFDSVYTGNTAKRRKLTFIPDGAKYIPTKDNPLKDDYDEWIARIICFAFSLSPQAFAKSMNRATAQTAQDTAEKEGLAPIMCWTKELIDFIIKKYFGYDDVEFAWQEEIENDALKQAQISDIYAKNGVMSIDEIRDQQGLDPIGMSNAVYTAQGYVLLKDVINPPEVVEPQVTQPNNKKQQNTDSSLQTKPNVNEKSEQKLYKREKKKPVY